MSVNLLSLGENSDSDSSDEDYVPNDERNEPDDGEGNSTGVESEEERNDNNEFHNVEERSVKKSQRNIHVDSSEIAAPAEPPKKSVDELWGEFLRDTNEKPSSSCSVVHAVADSTNSNDTDHPKPSDKIVITEIFDFAGEEIKVTKEVDADSREARRHLKSDETKDDSPKPTVVNQTSSLKRPAGLSGVLSQIGKKQKMGTFEKSKLDWESFKQNESLNEELANHNRGRDGFLEKQEFLQRSDYRQFERERNLRITKRRNV